MTAEPARRRAPWPWIAAALATAATIAFPFAIARINAAIVADEPRNLALLLQSAASSGERLVLANRVAAQAKADPFALREAAKAMLESGDADAARDLARRAADAFMPYARWPDLFADDLRGPLVDNAALLGRLSLADADTRDEGLAWLMFAASADPMRAQEILALVDDTTLAQCGENARRALQRMRKQALDPGSACAPPASIPRDNAVAALEGAGLRRIEAEGANPASEGIILSEGGVAIYTPTTPYVWRYGPAGATRDRARWLMLAGGRASGIPPLVRVESSLGWSRTLCLPDTDWFAVELAPRGAEESETLTLRLLSASSSTAWRLPSESESSWFEHSRHVFAAGVWTCAEEAP